MKSRADIAADKKTSNLWADPRVTALVNGAPADWHVLRLQDVCTRITDGTHKTPSYQQSGVRFISIKNIRPFKPINWDSYEKFISREEHHTLTRRCKPEVDDILFPRIGTLGFAKRIDFNEEVSIFVGLGLLKPNKATIKPKYLEYWMNHPLIASLSRDRANGSGRLTLPLEETREFPVIVPPLSEQSRVVDEVEKQFSRLDEAVANLQRVKANLGRYRSAVLREAFSDQSQAWRWGTFSDAGEVTTGFTPATSEPANFGGDVPFFKPTDLDAGDNVRLAREYLTAQGLRQGRRLAAGSVLVTCIGATIGKTGLAQVECATNQQINAVSPREGLMDARFLYWWTVSPLGRRQILDNASATTLPIINKSKFSALSVPFPPLAEQHRIVAEVDRRLSIVRAVEVELVANLKRAQSLRKSVLQAAFACKQPA